jgi:[acyl-carrier-protein] S-malonyltransferase
VSYALLFAGQGGQHAGMLPWLESAQAALPTLSTMASALGADWRSTLHDEALRSHNRFAQTLLTGTSLAAWEALKPLLPGLPAVVAGYSVGELAACACAGVLDNAAAIHLADQRACAMDHAAQGQGAGLLSVSGLVVERVLRLHPRLSPAILIAADHAIFGAPVAELDAAQQQLSQAGASCKRLAIGVASHTPLMAAATHAFARHLQDCALQPPAVPVVLNASARLCRRVDELEAALSTQISTTVDWAACMDAVAERGVSCVLEIGPGNALSTMWNRRHAAPAARALEDFRDAAGAARWVGSR